MTARRPRPTPRLRVEALHVLVAGDVPGRLGIIREIVAATLDEPVNRGPGEDWSLLLHFPGWPPFA